MKLIGVLHSSNLLDIADRSIYETCNGVPKSLLLELPINYRDFYHLFKPNFFSQLAERYSRRGTRIIDGDIRQRFVRKGPFVLTNYHGDLKTLFDSFLFHSRDRGFVESIKEQNPEAVAIGRGHADYVKRIFPDAYYAAFHRPQPVDLIERLLLKPPYEADRIILV
ncbi:MAG: hypothetical protein HYW26_03750 [Candidatus Aenigmarchaeota archaeon]|nr:hypothetical protein [Candidatus Aenigmarchaeota archaeon]